MNRGCDAGKQSRDECHADSGDGKRFEDGDLDFPALRDIAAANGEPQQISGRQELVENIINDYIVRGDC